MTDLIDEVKRSFDKTRETREDDGGRGPIQVIDPGTELAPGFGAMRRHYEQRLLVIARRGYRHFAGSSMPRNADVLLEITSEVMMPQLLATLLESFADGVQLGHKIDEAGRMCFHFHNVDAIYASEDFRDTSKNMALGFSRDAEVLEFFTRYINGGVEHLSHITGFAHNDVEPTKVWDIWLLIGTAVASASFLAGQQMGLAWAERDVLDGIEIATEEGSHGSS